MLKLHCIVYTYVEHFEEHSAYDLLLSNDTSEEHRPTLTKRIPVRVFLGELR